MYIVTVMHGPYLYCGMIQTGSNLLIFISNKNMWSFSFGVVLCE